MGKFDIAKVLGHDAAALLEKLLPAGSDDAARAALRKSPEKYQEYLKALEEAYGPQAERAKQMGFGDRDWYHGTAEPFDSFSNEYAGNSGREHKEPAHFFTHSPRVAGEYANWASMGKTDTDIRDGVWEKLQKQLERAERADRKGDQVGLWHAEQRANELEQQLKEVENSNGANIIPVRLRGERPLKVNMDGGHLEGQTVNNALTKAKAAGREGVVFHNTQDVPNTFEYMPSDIAAVFKPEQIRSRFAAFDPRFKDSKDLLAGAAGAAALGGLATSSDDSNAAGIQTIMQKLGVGLEEAQKIKQAAQEIAPQGLNDENLRAIRDVKGLVNLDDGYAELGKGDDYIAHLAPSGRVVKEPIRDKTKLRDVVSPPLMDSIGMGVNTKTVRLGDSPYLVQDKVTPLNKISESAYRRNDPKLDQLYKQLHQAENKAWQDIAQKNKWPDPESAIAYQRYAYRDKHLPQPTEEMQRIQDLIDHRTQEIYRDQGIDANELKQKYQGFDKQTQARLAHPDPEDGAPIQTASDIPNDIENAFTLMLSEEARHKLGNAITPFDLHRWNIGVNDAKKPVAFDTSRFQNFNADALSPEQKQKILNSYIATPQSKMNLKDKIKAGAAGAALLGGAGLVGTDDAEATPLDKARLLAEEYAKLKGLNSFTHELPEAKVKVSRAKKIAQAFDEMEHNPNDPDVKAAYDALINETVDQYKLLKEKGLRTSKITPDMENPYKSSADMIKDIAENNHLYYFPTEQGFGNDVKYTDHPLLQPVEVNGEKIPANDVFRIVHDYFGHAKEGNKFGPKGEENAWRNHLQMYSPEAQKALTTETRGQNSWVNYGPEAVNNRANPAKTIYADQKAGLLPAWAMDTKALAAMAGAGALAGIPDRSNASPEDVNPLPSLEGMLAKYRSGLGQVADKAANAIVQNTTPIPAGSQRDAFVKDNAPLVSTGLQVMGDPTNFIPGAPEALFAHDLFSKNKED
jgi:hypothetical protein